MTASQIILRVISDNLKITIDQMKSDSVDRNVVKARHFVFYFVRSYTKLYLSSIGKLLLKDHSSVSYAYKNVTNLVSIYPDYMDELNKLKLIIERKLSIGNHVIMKQVETKGRRSKKYDEVFMENDFYIN